MARAQGLNSVTVKTFFDNYCEVLNKHKFTPDRIFNLDETGVTNAPTGRKQVGQVTASERGNLVTVTCIIGANGNALPPVMVYPRIRMNPTAMAAGAHPGTLALNSRTGWMTGEIFVASVLPHIVRHTGASKETPILLLMDRPSASHVSLETVEFCRANGIVVLTFPPHCSHKLQPLRAGCLGVWAIQNSLQSHFRRLDARPCGDETDAL